MATNFNHRNEFREYEAQRELERFTNRFEAVVAGACLIGLAVWAVGKYMGVWA